METIEVKGEVYVGINHADRRLHSVSFVSRDGDVSLYEAALTHVYPRDQIVHVKRDAIPPAWEVKVYKVNEDKQLVLTNSFSLGVWDKAPEGELLNEAIVLAWRPLLFIERDYI